jgi:hypothetical protein
MAAFTVHQGKRYRAAISLGVLERFASNDTIAERLRTAGFTDISVSGAGRALWPAPDATAELPIKPPGATSCVAAVAPDLVERCHDDVWP